jgi:AcrR family transcriptional regulator
MPRTAPQPATALDGRSRTRTALLDAAARRYARFGPRKTTMEEVARDAGCSRATAYKHFSSKDALYRSLLERSTRGFVDELRRCIAAPGPARAKLRRIVEITVEVYAQSPVLLGAASQDDEMRIEAIAAVAMRRQEAEIIGLLAEVLREGIEAGAIRRVDPERVAYLMYHLGNLLVIRELSGRRDYPLEPILDAMDDLLGRGLALGKSSQRKKKR